MNFEKAAHLAQVIGSLGVLPGFLGLYYTMEQQRQDNERIGKSMRLAALGAVNEMIEKDRLKQLKIPDALRFVQGLPMEKNQLLARYGSGKALYYAEPALAEVGRHYEHLGAMVKLGYVDFDLIFEVISFPDDFWEGTAPLMEVIRENWGGAGKPLPDLWSNFRNLRERYHEQREKIASVGQDRQGLKSSSEQGTLAQ